MKKFLSSILALTLSSLLYSHSYNIVEVLSPDEDRAFLLIKDNHELASTNENLEELGGIKNKLKQLNRDKRETLVLTESMWMYGRQFRKAHVEEAIRAMLDVIAPNFKGQIRADSHELQKYRNTVAYLDIPLPLEIANLTRNEYVRGESVDPRLPLLRLSRLLENKGAKKIKVSLDEIWAVVVKAKDQIDDIYQLGGASEIYDIDPDFWKVVEDLSQEALKFETLLSKIVPKEDIVTKLILTKKNVKTKLSNSQIESLKDLVRMDPNNMRAHAWTQDITTIRKIIDPRAPATVIIAAGGMHLDLLQRALIGLGCSVKSDVGVSTEEIMAPNADKSPLLAQNNVEISRELRAKLTRGLLESLSPLNSSDVDEGTSDEVKYELDSSVTHDERENTSDSSFVTEDEACLPSLALPQCGATGCTKPGLQQCGACRVKTYCSKECQRSDWPNHRAHCKK